ncbi:hypothetical protein BJ912DRAFT_1061724 [Pholiota molesta]|nr:hypothetical protein BJ912DRAFT_1061724 [Pholiota molesta]
MSSARRWTDVISPAVRVRIAHSRVGALNNGHVLRAALAGLLVSATASLGRGWALGGASCCAASATIVAHYLQRLLELCAFELILAITTIGDILPYYLWPHILQERTSTSTRVPLSREYYPSPPWPRSRTWRLTFSSINRASHYLEGQEREGYELTESEPKNGRAHATLRVKEGSGETKRPRMRRSPGLEWRRVSSFVQKKKARWIQRTKRIGPLSEFAIAASPSQFCSFITSPHSPSARPFLDRVAQAMVVRYLPALGAVSALQIYCAPSLPARETLALLLIADRAPYQTQPPSPAGSREGTRMFVA